MELSTITVADWCEIAKALVIIISVIAGYVFKVNQKDRAEVARTVIAALEIFKKNFDRGEAIKQMTSSGKISIDKAEKIVGELASRLPDSDTTDDSYNNHIIPGVALEITADGNVSVNPTGLLNKSAYKITKWFKKRIK